MITDKLWTDKFEVLTVDQQGQVVDRGLGQANFFTVALAPAIEIVMLEIPAGTFIMGAMPGEFGQRPNEKPQHLVTLERFFLARYPVTQAQWQAVMARLPDIDPSYLGDDLPVVNVYWEEVEIFCAKLYQLTGAHFRLPSEAEWEYACRAGTTTPFHYGDTITAELANFNGTKGYRDTPPGQYRGGLTPVGYFQNFNRFGLSDMHGNVWEWCADVWHENYEGAPTDGSVWLSGGEPGYRVQRGGCWRDSAMRCRTALRVGDIAHNSDHIVGLRLCLSSKTN